MSRASVSATFSAAAALLLTTGASGHAQTPLSLRRADGASVPVLDYRRAAPAECGPAMIVSHGFGGSEAALKGLANALSVRGWRVLVMGHRESGPQQLRAAMQAGGGWGAVDAAARQRSLHVARFADLDATHAEATRLCRPRPLVLAGHSMGSQTTMMEAGAVPLIGRMGSNRFDAYIALSPQGIGTTYAAGAWSGVSKPVLMVTGTNDRTVDADYTARLTAFDGLPAGRKRLAIISGAGHLQIGGIGSAGVDAAVNRLVGQFVEQVSQGTWGPVQVGGVTVRDK
jgi:dienelactone hydrolase